MTDVNEKLVVAPLEASKDLGIAVSAPYGALTWLNPGRLDQG